MTTQTASDYFSGLDLRKGCRNFFVEAVTSSVKRMLCHASPMQNLARAVNHLLGAHPRMMFSQCQTTATMYNSGTSSNPLYRWKYNDLVENGLKRKVRYLYLQRTAGTGNAYVGTSDGDGNEYATGSKYAATAGSVTWPDDLRYDSFTVSARPQSGAPPGSATAIGDEVVDGIRVYNGMTVMDVVVEDVALETLIVGTHRCADPGNARPGGWALANIAGDVRSDLQAARRQNLGIAVNWCATCSGGTWATPATTNATAIVIDAVVTGEDTYVSVFDQSVTSRSATSIGISAHAQHCGVGDSGTLAAGKQVPVVCEILAAIQSGVTGARVKFIGPDHIANNYTEITVSSTTPTWYGVQGTNYAFLNPAAADTDVTTARNKIDIHAKCHTGGGNSRLYIYALRGYLLYPPELW